jgi:hypothetical protein
MRCLLSFLVASLAEGYVFVFIIIVAIRSSVPKWKGMVPASTLEEMSIVKYPICTLTKLPPSMASKTVFCVSQNVEVTILSLFRICVKQCRTKMLFRHF